MIRLVTLIVTLTLLLGGLPARALTLDTPTIDRDQQAEPIPDKLEPVDRTRWQNFRYGPRPGQPEVLRVQPFGSHLFNGGFRGTRSDGLNPGYRVAPGDQITLRIWGAVEINRVLPVDAQGNIFIPSVGPVHVQGVTHAELDATVRRAVQTVYPKQVQVYTNLQGVQPVSVFVTGYVRNPGRYAGTPSDSLLYFLDQAGGIDPLSGSYRSVRVIRNGETIAEADLYKFLIEGALPLPQFRDGDTVIVDRRGPVVTVTGDVERDLSYELTKETLNGQSLLELIRLTPDISHALLRGTREGGPYSRYLPLAEFADAKIRDGDEVLLTADQRDDTIVVQVEGSYYGPSRYVVPRDTRLLDLLDQIAVPGEITDTDNISLRRLSVAERQRASLQDSLARLESTYLTAPSATREEADIRVKEAELIQTFVKRAAEVEPQGRLVVASRGEIRNIRLQNGDIITIPERSDALLISGEVLVPQSMVYTPGDSVEDYIARAGGFSAQADKNRILIVRLNGEVVPAEGNSPRPGDEILVLPEVPTKNLQLATSITQIIYQIAIAAKVAVGL